MIEKLDSIDRKIFLFLNSKHVDWLDPIMWFISEPWVWVPVYLVFLYKAYRIKNNWKEVWGILVGIGIVVLLADNIHREWFKEVFERLRPSRNPELEGLVHLVEKPNGDLYTGGRFGFISGHASNFIGIATFIILSLNFKRLGNALLYSGRY